MAALLILEGAGLRFIKCVYGCPFIELKEITDSDNLDSRKHITRNKREISKINVCILLPKGLPDLVTTFTEMLVREKSHRIVRLEWN